jgi:hypothetical protein
MSSSISTSDGARPLRRRTRGSAGGLVWRWLAWFCAGLFGTFVVGVALVLLLLDGDTILRYKHDMVEWKLARLREPGRPPHVVVVSGSNALYSVDSAALAEAVGMPATNLGVHWGIGLHAAELAADVVVGGDIVLMPLEYEYYEDYADGDRMPWVEACYLLAHDRGWIKTWDKWLQVLSQCQPKMMLGGVVLKMASFLGIHYPRYDMSLILNQYGDMLENSPEKATYKGGAGATRMEGVEGPLSYPRLEEIAARLQAAGASVLFSFPVQPETDPGKPAVSAAWLEALRNWASRHGAFVMSHPARHQFPADCFFDGPYHLHQGCTGENARRYGAAVSQWLRQRARPAEETRGHKGVDASHGRS